ncbi:MAG: PaaI family thioesterase [Armatimonadota bacterium]
MKVEVDDFCFVCGQQNPHGLRLSGFCLEGERYRFEWTPKPYLQGWQKIVHGGIIATVLDEAVTRLFWELSKPAVTAEITVRFVRPLFVGTKTLVEAWKVRERGRLLEAEATISDKLGEYARSRALMLRVDGS